MPCEWPVGPPMLSIHRQPTPTPNTPQNPHHHHSVPQECSIQDVFTATFPPIVQKLAARSHGVCGPVNRDATLFIAAEPLSPAAVSTLVFLALLALTALAATLMDVVGERKRLVHWRRGGGPALKLPPNQIKSKQNKTKQPPNKPVRRPLVARRVAAPADGRPQPLGEGGALLLARAELCAADGAAAVGAVCLPRGGAGAGHVPDHSRAYDVSSCACVDGWVVCWRDPPGLFVGGDVDVDVSTTTPTRTATMPPTGGSTSTSPASPTPARRSGSSTRASSLRGRA